MYPSAMHEVNDKRNEPTQKAYAAAVVSLRFLARPSGSQAPPDTPTPEYVRPYRTLLPLHHRVCAPTTHTAHDPVPVQVHYEHLKQPGKLMGIADLPVGRLPHSPSAQSRPHPR